jgi:hypothetical protein
MSSLGTKSCLGTIVYVEMNFNYVAYTKRRSIGKLLPKNLEVVE